MTDKTFSGVPITRIAVDDPDWVGQARNEAWYENALITAVDWQRLTVYAPWWEFQVHSAGHVFNAGSELAGLAGATGELFLVGVTATAEARAWSLYRRAAPLDDSEQGRARDAAREISHRATCDHALWTLVAVGHYAANMALRSVLLSPAASGLADKWKMALGQAAANDRNHWVSLNAGTVEKLGTAIQSVSDVTARTTLSALVDCLDTILRSAPWRRATDYRNQDWHRWRPQSAGMQGVPKAGLWSSEALEDGTLAKSMNLGPVPYSEAAELAEKMTGTACELTEVLHTALSKQMTLTVQMATDAPTEEHCSHS